MSNLSPSEEAQLLSTIEMFEVITQSQPLDPQSWEILKEAYFKLGKQKEVLNTSKKLAQVYVQLGQLSSAILEYETILQRHPDDKEVAKALQDIEQRASSFGSGSQASELESFERTVAPSTATAAPVSRSTPSTTPPSAPTLAQRGGQTLPPDFDDGKAMMQKLFVDAKHIAAVDFNQLWMVPKLQGMPDGPSEPFIQLVSDRNIIPVEKSIRMIADRARLAFMPLGKYDVDLDTAKMFSKEVCRRWCVLPFDKMSKSILVATANPFNKEAIKEMEAQAKGRLLWYLTTPSDLFKLVQKIYR